MHNGDRTNRNFGAAVALEPQCSHSRNPPHLRPLTISPCSSPHSTSVSQPCFSLSSQLRLITGSSYMFLDNPRTHSHTNLHPDKPMILLQTSCMHTDILTLSRIAERRYHHFPPLALCFPPSHQTRTDLGTGEFASFTDGVLIFSTLLALTFPFFPTLGTAVILHAHIWGTNFYSRTDDGQTRESGEFFSSLLVFLISH